MHDGLEFLRVTASHVPSVKLDAVTHSRGAFRELLLVPFEAADDRDSHR